MSDTHPKEMQKEQDANTIILDKQKILDAINADKKYEDNDVLIRRWEGSDENDSYISQITRTPVSFIGILNGKFEREGYGINNFSNGDKYLGYFEDDKRSKHGIYLFNPKITDDIIEQECYYGFWKNNKKNHHGIYIWMKENINNTDFDNANFSAYIGEIRNDQYKRGSFLTKDDDNYYLYHGNFDADGTKNDDKAFFYSAKNDRLIRGKIVNNVFVNGYVAFFDEEGEVRDLVYVEFDSKDKVKALKQSDEMEEDEKNNAQEDLTRFRNVILDTDYFGELYQRYKDVKSFINEHMNTIEVLDDKDKFPDIIKLCVDYNNNNIYDDIEKIALVR
jgi:hypothetical protein